MRNLKKPIKNILKFLLILAILFAVLTVIYLGYLFFTVVIPMGIELLYAMFK